MITFERLMRYGGSFTVLKYVGDEIKTLEYNVVYYKRGGGDVFNIGGEIIDGKSVDISEWNCLLVGNEDDADKAYLFDGYLMFVADKGCVDEARIEYINKLIERENKEIDFMKERIKKSKKEIRKIKALRK